VFEVSEDHLGEFSKDVKSGMESVVLLENPLTVNLKIGTAWGDLKPYNI